MRVIINDAHELDRIKRIIRRRQITGGDRFDEVWDGVYVMSPLANNEHQKLAYRLTKAIDSAHGDETAQIFTACNVSDRPEHWKKNFRCPDVAVFLPGNPAEDRNTYWLGGPDFAVEILSPRDRARLKLEFYASVGVRELLLVDRKPWQLELYRLTEGRLDLAATSKPSDPPIESTVLDVRFRLLPAEPRPQIEVTRPADGRIWLA